ncbi:MAG TPA: hypothetical protein VKH36_08265, partial [Acidimicrobiia bacterium]|nr:hypothetical protein [Acidimicrobiia bacterium]
DDLYERVAPDLIASRPGYPGTRPDPILNAGELVDSPLFRSVMERRYPWTETYTTASYLELMATHSGHRMLPTAVFTRLADGLMEIIDRIGGELRLDYVARLYLARRVGDSRPRAGPGPETGRR